jgi:hypothetical protein
MVVKEQKSKVKSSSKKSKMTGLTGEPDPFRQIDSSTGSE